MVCRHQKFGRRFRRSAVLSVLLVASAAGAGGPSDGNLNISDSSSVAPPATRKQPAKDWREETEATCGMACRYHRANDNLTMQALYLVTKIQKIDDEYRRDPKSKAIPVALGGFCETKAEAVGDCIARYKDFQKIALVNIRQAIGTNEDTIARLTSGRKADGTVAGTAVTFASGEKAVPYLPDVPTLQEMEKSYLQGNLKPAGSKYSRADIQKWSEELVVNDPKTKYLQFFDKPTVGNPYQKEKSGYSLYMEKRNGEADSRAVGVYEKSVKSVQGFIQDAKNGKVEDGTMSVTPLSDKFKDQDSLSYEAFIQSRKVVNSKLEGDLKRGDAAEKLRQPANDPDAKTTKEKDSRDVDVRGAVARSPSGAEDHPEDYKIERPAEMKNSRYIRYDLGDLMNDIESK
jgi:hypothetical protein